MLGASFRTMRGRGKLPTMSTVAKPLKSVGEFLAWAEGRDGRWELQDGELVAMAPERVAHLETKAEALIALRSAIRRANAPCHAVPDGATVHIAAQSVRAGRSCLLWGPPPARLD